MNINRNKTNKPQGFGIYERRYISVTDFAAQSTGTDPCASASSVQSVFYRTPPIINDDKKPQMNADKRRFVTLTHCKECEERKANEQKSLRPLRSLRLKNFHGIPTAQGNKATMVFQTGFTGSTGW